VLFVNQRLAIPLTELQFHFARSGGPGGQHVNKTSTKAVLRWAAASSPSLPEPVRARFLTRYRRRITKLGDLVLSSQRFRDRGRNVADCLARLRDMLAAVAEEPVVRKATRPTRGSAVRRRQAKEARSRTKQLRRGQERDE